jgi:peptidoglycan/LPS O-acetylase OafA/YrhL
LAIWPTRIPDFIFAHYFEWFLGMYMVERLANHQPVNIPFLAFLVLVLLTGISIFNPHTILFTSLFAGLASAALLANCVPDRDNSILSNKGLVVIGVFSYSLYLVHIPILDLFWNGTQIVRESWPVLPSQTAMLGIVFAFVVGYFFFLLFEQPYLGEVQKAKKLSPGLKEQAW